MSVAQLGKKANEEKARIADLRDVYNTAVDESWEPEQFLKFVEDNTDLDFVVSIDGADIDLKGFFTEAGSRLMEHRKEERKEQYFTWLDAHIRDSECYLTTMHLACAVAGELISDASLSYFSLTQLRSGMEQVEKTLKYLGKGNMASLTTESAIRDYGTAYVQGMDDLIKGYNKVRKLRGTGSDKFVAALESLQEEIGAVRQLSSGNYKPKQLKAPVEE